MARLSHAIYVAQYLGFCDGDGRVEPRRCSERAVTETFLHETAISVPQLWRLGDRLPAKGSSLGGDREGARSKVYAHRDDGVIGALENGVRSAGITIELSPPPLADAGHSAIWNIDCK
jgi:hypothetical protein